MMIFDRNEQKQVVALLGAGSMSASVMISAVVVTMWRRCR